MSIIFKQDRELFKASDVLWAKPELVNAIVEQALLSQSEAFVDMIIDLEKPEEITRSSVNETLRGVKDSTNDFLADVIFGLQLAIQKRLEEVNYGAAVTGIKYDLAGDVTDIELDISVS